MTLVNGIWYDNEIGRKKKYDGVGSDHLHKFTMGKNSDKIPIVICEKCNKSRMWITTFEEENGNKR